MSFITLDQGQGWRAVVAGAALAMLAGVAQARTEVVSWSYVSPCMIDGFELHYGASPTDLDQSVDVGRPRQAGGHFSYPLDLPDQDEVFVCVAAIRGQEKSVCSDTVSLPPSTSGSPRTDPAPGAANRSWCEDFNSGTSVAWVDTGPDNSLVRSPGLFGVTDLGDANYALSTSSPDDDVHSHFLGVDIGGLAAPQWSRYEYSGQMQFTDASAQVGVTLYSRFNIQTGYYRLSPDTQGDFALTRDQVDPTYRCVSLSAPPEQAAPNVWYAFRVQVENGSLHTELKLKVWPADKREPDGFQARCTDSSSDRQLSGTVGVWSAGPGMKLWDNLYVAELAEPLAGDPVGAPGKPELVP